MPRTPLLARVRTLTSVARTALRTGAPADELLDAGAAGPLLTRRAALGYAAAGVALGACADASRLLTPRDVAPIGPRPDRASAPGARVAVVGAGLAGLTCAYRLRERGIRATVHEASGRVGGRCWTDRTTFADGQIAEHGGELIDQGHTTIRQLAQELGLVLDNVLRAEPAGTEPFFHFGGTRYAEADAVRDLKAVWQPLKRDYVAAGYPTSYTRSTPRGRALDAMSVRDWIATTVPGGLAAPLGRLLDVAYTIEYGADTGEQSALNLVYLLGALGQGQLRPFGPSNEKYKVRGGNDRIVQALQNALDGQIAVNAALAAITRAGSAWTLHFDDGRTVAADHVVLALPFRLLRERVALSSGDFPEPKRRAIAELGMGRNAKLALQFTARHWNALGNGGDTYADTGYQATWEVTRAQAGRAGILVNYTGGAATDAQGGRLPSALATEFLARVEPVLPGLGTRWNTRVRFDDWPRDPWTLGSYSYYRPGQYQRFGGAEGEAVGSCHFAGEHTSVDAQGYLEGAVESGARAAREVLADLGVIAHA